MRIFFYNDILYGNPHRIEVRLETARRFGALSEVCWLCGGYATEPETRRPFNGLETVYYRCHQPASCYPRGSANHYSFNPCQSQRDGF